MSEETRGNLQLRRERECRNLTQEGLASQLTELAAAMYAAGELTRRTSASPRQCRRWESPDPGWPYPDHRKLLERFYGKPITELGFVPPGTPPVASKQETAAPSPARPTAWAAGKTTPPLAGRREAPVIDGALGLAARGSTLPWMSAVTGAIDNNAPVVGDEDVVFLREAAQDLDATDQRFGGDRLWRGARSQLLYLHYLIDQGVYAEAIGQELHAIAGQLTTSLGWFCYDAGQQTDARVYFSEALNTAMLAGDDALATRTLSNMARQSVDLGKAREAIRFARIAQAHALEWSATPRVNALLSIREAQGHARLNDETSARTAIKQAWKHFEQGPSRRDPDWTSFLNEAELTCLEGMCHVDLGQHNKAVRLLDKSSRIQDTEHSRNRGMCLARLAYAALQDGDLDQGTEATGESLRLLEGGMSSTRNLRQLGVVRGGLLLHPHDAKATEMAERLTAYIA
jgi:hypothetical protein